MTNEGLAARPLDGRVAVVTGAASGIGRASAIALASAGAAVVVADVDGDGVAATASAITSSGERSVAAVADMRSNDDVARMVALAVDTYGHLDLAFNNAGIDVPHLPLADVDEDDWDAILDVDLKGVWRCLRAELPVMVEGGGGGAIVNTSSMAGIMGVGGAAAYCSAKHGVIGLTRVAALDYAAADIRVNALTPGLVRTPLITKVLGDAVEALVATRPTGRIPEPEDVAAAVVWLCSPAARFVTGQALQIS